MNTYKNKILIVLLFGILSLNCAKAQEKYIGPALTDENSWTLALLPDPQTYVKFDYNRPIFDLMLSWINKNVDVLNIASVLCTGDLVENNDNLYPDGKTGNMNSVGQWEGISQSFDRLNGRVPYILTTGNHDYGYKSAENRKTFYDAYFPISKNSKNEPMLREIGFNIDLKPSLSNAVFEMPQVGKNKYLVLVLEFAPRDTVLDWAKNIVAQDKYKDHRVILLTHSYLNSSNEHIKTEGYKLENPNYGSMIWEKLVYPSKNICMVFAGHIGKPNDPNGHIAFRTDKNQSGRKVQQMVFNAQALGGGWHGNGGDGWLRLLEFMPDNKTVKVKTFSPLFAISPTTQKYAWRKEAVDEFEFTLED